MIGAYFLSQKFLLWKVLHRRNCTALQNLELSIEAKDKDNCMNKPEKIQRSLGFDPGAAYSLVTV